MNAETALILAHQTIEEREAEIRHYRAAWRRVETENSQLRTQVESHRAFMERVPYPSDHEIAEGEIRDLRRCLHVIDLANDAQLAKKALACEFAYVFDHAKSLGLDIPAEGARR